MRRITFLFDGPPGPVAGRFIDTIDEDTGEGVGGLGEWSERENGWWGLTVPMPSPVEPVHNARGFQRHPALPSQYGGTIQTYESSAASGPHLWVRTVCPKDLSEPNGPTVEAVAHLTLDDAVTLAEQILSIAANHYQGDQP